MFKKIPFFVFVCALVPAAALAGHKMHSIARFDGEGCDRTLTYDTIMKSAKWSATERAEIDSDKQVAHYEDDADGYPIGYVVKTAKYDAELVMGVYSSCHEHAGNNGLGDFIKKSEIRGSDPAKPGNPFKVYYEQQVSWPYDNGEYIVENTVTAELGGYLLSSKLLESSDVSFSPKIADGYMRVLPHSGGKVLVIACNYMVPRSGAFKGTFVDLAKKRLDESGKRLLAWVKRVNADRSKSDGYRDRLRGILGGNSQ
jgi:hypothetical protein